MSEIPLAAGGSPAGSVVRQVEGRLVWMVVLIRLGTMTFLLLPLAKWPHLRIPALAVVVAVVAAVEAVAFAVVARRRGLAASLVVADVATCVVLMGLGSRAVAAAERNVVMTELIPFSLASAAVVGVSRLSHRAGASLVATMMAAWIAALYPVLPLKTLSDQLGFALWFVIGRAISAGWRRLAEAVDRAELAARLARERLTERERHTAEVERQRREAQHRATLHREVHDVLLPVVEHVATGRPVTPGVVEWAGTTARGARRRLEASLGDEPDRLLDRLAQAAADAEARGLRVDTSLATRCEPPGEVTDTLVAAIAEALTNVIKHSRRSSAVLSALDDDGGGVCITVRDTGRGFDPGSVGRGGGLGRTYAAVERQGGTVQVEAAPGAGTTVTVTWVPHHAARTDFSEGVDD